MGQEIQLPSIYWIIKDRLEMCTLLKLLQCMVSLIWTGEKGNTKYSDGHSIRKSQREEIMLGAKR